MYFRSIGILIIFTLGFAGVFLNTHFASKDKMIVGTATVYDGDGIYLDTGYEVIDVRLFGVDAPELEQPCFRSTGEAYSCGIVAKSFMAKRLDGRRIKCIVQYTDRYERAVSICKLGGDDVSRELVSEGMARAARQYSLKYIIDESSAVSRSAGFWEGSWEAPWAYRRARFAQKS